jgi:endonuclease/exonuclease/phosphatase family metal-dependent hydrolase
MVAFDATRLRLLTLNCWLLRWGPLPLARDLAFRAEAIPEAIAATGADVVLLQEVWSSALAAAMARRLRPAGYGHVVRSEPRRGLRPLRDGLMIASRHPLSAPAALTLGPRSVWYERLIAKGALAADVSLPSGDVLRVATAHLAVVRFDLRRRTFRARDERTRSAQLERLAGWLETTRPQGHLVVAGDLNLTDRAFSNGRYEGGDSADYRALLARLRLRDAYRESGSAGEGFTFDPAANAYAARGALHDTPGQRIDYVLYRSGTGLAAEGAEVVFREAPLLSDHYGVRADFRLAPKIPASSAGGVTSSWS